MARTLTTDERQTLQKFDSWVRTEASWIELDIKAKTLLNLTDQYRRIQAAQDKLRARREALSR